MSFPPIGSHDPPPEEPAPPDPADLDLDTLDEPRPAREGLPPGYRMRHEPHYVDALLSSPRPVVPRESPVVLAAAAREVSSALDGVLRSVGDLTVGGRGLRERLGVELIKAESRRAMTVCDALTVLMVEPALALRPVDLTAAVRAVVDGATFALRLIGSEPRVHLAADVTVRADERWLRALLDSLLLAMSTMVGEGAGWGALEIAVPQPSPGAPTRSVEFVQRRLALPQLALLRFFDGGWAEHPAGPAGALALGAAHRLVALHAGHLSVSGVEGGGCRVTATLPA
jgi:hypothetical protein